MSECVEATNIPMAMVGLLTALPNTQLTRRLAREGRLHVDFESPRGGGDQCTAGLNFATLRPRRDILADYRDVLTTVYGPAAYFGRIRRLAGTLDRAPYLPPLSWPVIRRDLKAFGRLLYRFTIGEPRLARHFWSALIFCARTNPRALQVLLFNMVPYLHLGPFAAFVIRELDAQIAAIDAGRYSEPAIFPMPAELEPAARAVA